MPGFDQVEGILVTFPSLTATGSGGSALDDDDSALTVMSREKIQRVADIGSVQVSAQDHLDLLLDKAVDRTPCAGHRDIEDLVVSRCEVMVGNNDASHVLGHCRKHLFTMPQLMTMQSAVGNGAVWRG